MNRWSTERGQNSNDNTRLTRDSVALMMSLLLPHAASKQQFMTTTTKRIKKFCRQVSELASLTSHLTHNSKTSQRQVFAANELHWHTQIKLSGVVWRTKFNSRWWSD